MMKTLGIAVAGGLILAGGSFAARTVTALDDPTIVAIFDAANTWDIEQSAVAEKRSKNAEVVDLAKRFAHDHAAVRQQGRDLAKKLGVTPTPPKDFAMAKDHATAMAKLKSVSDAGFDRAYVENEVAYHKAVIDALTNTLIPAIQNAQFKSLAQQVVPAFQAHLAAAEALLAKLPTT